MTDAVLNFVKEVYPVAKQLNDINPIFTVAQGGLESGWGQKRVGKFNLFGMKAPHNWTGLKLLVRTKEVLSNNTTKFPVIHSITKRPDGKYVYDCEDYFIDFDTLKESLDYHFKLLQSPQFEHALKFKDDPIAYVTELQAGKLKYATATNYVDLMKTMIKMVNNAITTLKL